MESLPPDAPTFDPERFAATMAAVLMVRGAAREVALLAFGRLSFALEESSFGGLYATLEVRLPPALYGRLSQEERQEAESVLLQVAQEVRIPPPDGSLTGVTLMPALDQVPKAWRDDAVRWIRGQGITNQGRVRSDNIAPRLCDGLLFRSQPEIELYRALKGCGVAFAPLPVFVKGGKTYQRVEPDFVIYQDGVVLIVEVDGDTVHMETPAEADQRGRIFKYEGAIIERVQAFECETEEKARVCAARLLKVIEKVKARR